MGIVEKFSSIFAFLKPSKKEKHKTLLLVGSHGETISIQRFLGLTIFTTLVSIVTLVIIIYLLIITSSLRKENAELSEAVDEYKQKSEFLKIENAKLLTRLVALSEGESGTFEEQEPADKTPPQPPPQTEPSSNTIDPLNIEEEINRADRNLQNGTAVKKIIDVENLIVTHETNSKTLHVRFDLRNIDPNLNPVSGRTVVILKTDNQVYNNWLTLPFVPLVSGKPASTNAGRTFFISRFKTVKFSIAGQTNPNQYKTATVFIFSNKGEQLLEKDFTVEVKEVLAASAQSEDS